MLRRGRDCGGPASHVLSAGAGRGRLQPWPRDIQHDGACGLSGGAVQIIVVILFFRNLLLVIKQRFLFQRQLIRPQKLRCGQGHGRKLHLKRTQDGDEVTRQRPRRVDIYNTRPRICISLNGLRKYFTELHRGTPLMRAGAASYIHPNWLTLPIRCPSLSAT